jgi:hypothetical protein
VCQSVSWEDTLTLVLLRATRDLAGGRGVYGVCNCTAKASVMTETWERGGTEKNFIGSQGEENE